MDSFWDFLWLVIVSFAFVAYLMVLFSIIGDLFRDHKTSGWVKAIWIFFLIVAPFLTALIYIIVKGGDMTKRQVAAVQHAKDEQDQYIKQVAGRTSAEEIAHAKTLLDNGTISQEEFSQLKEKALR
ncbi:SHOCT domain-containing protein [Rhodococcus sp. BP-252]|uniref:SHOCT domain-containing protein n=1 Tax=Rhodococcus sp. Eu-32 TaxID=1017319 RepID=UPI000A6AD7C3|nr:SHOCT domain-containing protein [Rhodococcus sp. Eu-32]MBY6410830.1 SHOCT domain-containing protein [Rhodococcus sp. BP-320]MBY6415345.1 SHOCT domain-containing protein [Rhodococcus sp. BP-321]MBY6419960.1 SHOCT domain-containing protein [Rhodococcus sp. BP-324]MBY6425386.1 SHOCT domain-containing protein [Rhodococcus sp. BP-323]MBY6430551.1 SHOCT domain-containing protein [Rhodococcus sp. BP-322]MBY6439571.1 SHOCT domain-containing protein [Rhodococcus sp. BP-319]MBY6444388.1 SHOCT domai